MHIYIYILYRYNIIIHTHAFNVLVLAVYTYMLNLDVDAAVCSRFEILYLIFFEFFKYVLSAIAKNITLYFGNIGIDSFTF